MLNIVIPMAGKGSRFIDAGYKNPKPFIDVAGTPMISRVMSNMKPDEEVKFTLIARTEHKKFIDEYQINADVVYLDKITEGAACTVLEGIKKLNLQDELIIINSDQLIDWPNGKGIQGMIDFARDRVLDGCITIFSESSDKFSYAKCNKLGMVTEVAEKKVISNMATAGTYYFRTVEMFRNYAVEMIRQNIRTNNEFYVCPVYNMLLAWAMHRVSVYRVLKVHELGTPEGLQRYLNEYTRNSI